MKFVQKLPLLFLISIAPVSIAPANARSSAEPVVIANSSHSSYVKSIAYSPNGTWLASGAEDGTVKLWDAKSGRLLRTLAGLKDEVFSVAISADGGLVAAVSHDGMAEIWEAKSGHPVQAIVAGQDSDLLNKVAFTHDGRSILIGSFLGVRKWDVATGELQKFFPLPGPLFLADSFVVSPDERWIGIAYKWVDKSRRWQSGIALIDVASGRTLTKFSSKDDESDILEVSPNGRWIASAGSENGSIKIWETTNGRLLRVLQNGSDSVLSVAFSPNGKELVAVDFDGVKFWDPATGDLLRAIQDKHAWTIAFSPDSRAAAVGHSAGRLTAIDTGTGKPLDISFGLPSDGRDVGVAAASNEQWLIAGPAGITVWNATTGQLLHAYQRDLGYVNESDFLAHAENGDALVVTHSDMTIRIWNARSGALAQTFEWGDSVKKGTHFESVAVSPDGRWLAAASNDGTPIKVWDMATAKLKQSLPAHSKDLQVTFSPDGQWLVSATDDDDKKPSLQIWDTDRGSILKTYFPSEKEGAFMKYCLAVSPDRQLIATRYAPLIRFGNGGQKLGLFTVALWDAPSGRLLRSLHHESISTDIEKLAFSADGQRLVTAVQNSESVYLWDTNTGRLLLTLEGNQGEPTSVAFSPDGRRVIAGNSNGTSAVWDSGSGQLLANTAQSQSGEWVTITPEGFFTASEKGAALLHVVEGFNITGIDQVYQSLYRPDLVQEKLAGDPDGKVKEAAAKLDLGKVMASGAAPKISIVNPANKSGADGDEITVEASVADQGGGIGKIEWRVNGTTLGVEERGLSRVEAPTGGPATTIKKILSLEPGENLIELVAYNEKDLIASEPAKITVNWDGDTGATLPKLYVLTVGVNDYWDGRLKLTYAVPDADALAEAFRQSGAGALYSAVEVRKVEDADVTIANLDKVFGELAQQVHARDAFVFFLAGHGKTIDGRYYFVPQDFRYEGEESIVKKGVDQDRLQAWFAQVPARRSVLLFDTCESGSLTGERVAQRGLERVAALDRMTQAMGRTVLSASTENAPALEGYHGHGVFTYVVLDGLGAADSNGNGTIEVTELASFVDQKVPELSYEAFKQRQVPQMKIVGSNFTLSNKVVVAAKDEALGDAVPSKPTHVVIAPVDVFAASGGEGAAVTKLAPGSLVALVRTEQSWVLIAKDGKSLGYVAAGSLAPIQ